MNSILFAGFSSHSVVLRTFEPIKVNPYNAKSAALNSSIIKRTWFFGYFTLFLWILVAYN